MALPREPRQKMINMMYLVLTAMLALNVSSEILNAFKTVNNSLEKSNVVVNASTNDIMTSLEAKLHEPGTAEKAQIWQPHAIQAQNYSKSMYDYLQNLKDTILKLAGANYSKGDSTYREDNLDISTRLMVDKGGGKKLLNLLTQYQKDLLGIDPIIKEQFSNTLPINLAIPKTQSKSNRTWEGAYFHMVPVVAALTILSKFQNDVKTAENKIAVFCHNKVGEVILRPDAFTALALANSTNVLPGQEIEITAGVGGFSKAVKPIITIGGQKVDLGDDGAAHQKITSGAVGQHTIPVKITFTDQDGKVQIIDKTIEYTVGQSNAAVQLDKMNVLFIGVDNPLTISGSGSVEGLQVSASGGGAVLSGSGAHRTVSVSNETDDCIISIRTVDGKVTPVKFRVRSIPNPSPMVGRGESGDIPAGEFKSQAGVRAILQNFYYETQFNVLSFRIVGDGAGFDEGVIEVPTNTGAAWNEAKKIIDKCRQGSVITIDEIRAIGPDKRVRKLTPLVYYLK